jgi:hypothetical protein
MANDDPFRADLQTVLDAAGAAPSIDLQTCFALAGSFYKSADGTLEAHFGAGWDQVAELDAPGGYDGVALYHPSSRTCVVVNRGTEGFRSFPDWQENVGAALFASPGPQMDSSFELLLDGYAKAAAAGPVDQILICGHSLGGALADAQGALAASLFEKNGLTCPPVRVVGVASAGFAHAAHAYASTKGLSPSTEAAHFITHYIRAYDAVPHHPGRSVFGTDQVVASVFESRREPPQSPKGPPIYEYRPVYDFLREHDCNLYFKFFDEPGSNYIWYSHGADGYVVRPGAHPPWSTSMTRPADY